MPLLNPFQIRYNLPEPHDFRGIVPCPRDCRLRIGIIGSGNIGGTLTRRLAAWATTSQSPTRAAGLKDLAAESGTKAVTVSEAAEGRDVVIVTIPQNQITVLPQGLFAGVPSDLVVVDTGNYYPRERDGIISGIEDGATESRWVSMQLGVPVVKAFNNIRAEDLMNAGKPAGTPGRIALPVAGDDPAAKAVVLRLIDELGFDGVDAGTIDESSSSSPTRPSMARISTPRACVVRWPRRARPEAGMACHPEQPRDVRCPQVRSSHEDDQHRLRCRDRGCPGAARPPDR